MKKIALSLMLVLAACGGKEKTAKYACDGGVEITAKFKDGSVDLVLAGFPAETFAQVEAASGARYEKTIEDGPTMVFWNKGDDATFFLKEDPESTTVNCKKK